MASGTYLQDIIAIKLAAVGAANDNISDKLRTFWISKGFADGDPGTVAKEAWYRSQLATGAGFNEVEFNYWDVIAP